jgi:hypothetical protein
VSSSVFRVQNKDNNNGMCQYTASQTAVYGTQAGQQMALQSAMTGQPMGTEGTEDSGHMTTVEPIGACQPKTDQKPGNSSHL